jgi:hypothetical protein
MSGVLVSLFEQDLELRQTLDIVRRAFVHDVQVERETCGAVCRGSRTADDDEPNASLMKCREQTGLPSRD